MSQLYLVYTKGQAFLSIILSRRQCYQNKNFKDFVSIQNILLILLWGQIQKLSFNFHEQQL